MIGLIWHFLFWFLANSFFNLVLSRTTDEEIIGTIYGTGLCGTRHG